ncbi:hypothetical protein HPP92_012782 [Vanilla planifolia]|uniref:Alpha-carbonic anhydrase domain-containing protein n=1 Tax=Vanilla planifolia TaxID=51239 RepID=A0A835QM73_VANPL|nr:hypothetical protein HPP92_012782 [Vanilla planifolia]
MKLNGLPLRFVCLFFNNRYQENCNLNPVTPLLKPYLTMVLCRALQRTINIARTSQAYSSTLLPSPATDMAVSRQLIFLFATIGFYFVRTAIAEAVEDVEFSYNTSAPNGPAHWGDLKEEWKTCKTGRMQSPIAIDDRMVHLSSEPENLQWNYSAADALLKYLNHHIVIEWKDFVGGVIIHGLEYPLQQVHWHTPSENTFNGQKFHLELHMLHERSDKKMAMVSIMFTIGQPDPFFAQLIQKINGKMGEELELGVVNPKTIKGSIQTYYRYHGSITIPPCTEGVIWTINRKIRTLSREQLKSLKDAIQPEHRINARPTQPLNNREVLLYR